MPIDTALTVLVFTFVTSATPGPNTLMVMASGVNFGFRRSVPHMLGVVIGFCLLLLCIGFGLGALLTLWPPLHLTLKIIGGCYLLYLAWRIATVGTLSAVKSNPEPMRLVAAMLFQWVNPKAWMMGVTAMALYTIPSEPYASVILITALFGLVGLPSVALWAGFGSVLRGWLDDPGRLRWFNRVMGLVLALTIVPMIR